MGVEKVEHLSESTIVSIYEPTRYGEGDVFRKVSIPHDPTYRAQLETISRASVQRPLNDPQGLGVKEMDLVEVPRLGTVVFIKNFDCDYSSATYRFGAHSVDGPYLLVEEVLH
jgi:hypothetical protein